MDSEKKGKHSHEESRTVSPLTWRSFSGIVYAAVVLMPAFLWLYFTTGALTSWAAMYTTVLLFSELARRGRALTKQETFVLMYGSGVAVGEAFLIVMYLFSAYFISSPIAAQFGLTAAIPRWVVPLPNSPAIMQRTFFHSDWVIPITLGIIGSLLGKGVGISLGFLTRHLYVEVEKLPFPMQQVEAQICITMANKESNKIRILTLCAIAAMAYSVILYAIPTISYAVRGVSLTTIPYPWLDLTHWVGSLLPGASFGIATDITVFAIALILPFNVVVSMFIGSFSFYFVGNAVLYHMGHFNEWWVPRMDLGTIWGKSILSFWASPLIGFILPAALLILVRHPKNLAKTFTDMLKMPKASRERGDISLKIILTVFLLSTLGSVAIVWILIPGFRTWVWVLILLSVGWTFIYTLASARAIGVTGMGFLTPYSTSLYAKEAVYIASGYPKADIWFAPLLVSSDGAYWCATFKVAQLTDTRPMDYVKAYIPAFILAWVMGLLYVSAFWSIAPIPSELFPCWGWPVNASIQSLFITRNVSIFKPGLLIGAAVLSIVIFGVIEIAHLPLSMIGLALGPTVAIPIPVSYLIGAIAAKFIERRMGKEWFQTNRSVIVAGLFTGVGFTIAISAAIALIARSMWASPY